MSGVRIDCWCVTCEQAIIDAKAMNGELGPMSWGRTFIVCPDCGNKRCPRATHHDHACTGSNEPGQPGSVYGPMPDPPATVEELRARILGGAR